MKAIVDEDGCIGCGLCAQVASEIFEMKDDKSVVVEPDECLGCESCVEVCEEGAITVEEI